MKEELIFSPPENSITLDLIAEDLTDCEHIALMEEMMKKREFTIKIGAVTIVRRECKRISLILKRKEE